MNLWMKHKKVEDIQCNTMKWVIPSGLWTDDFVSEHNFLQLFIFYKTTTMKNKENVFLLWGNDGEMAQIKERLIGNNAAFIDKWPGRWAKVEVYADEIKQLVAEGKQPVAIELIGAGEGEYADVISIDHHWERSHEKAAILQVLDVLWKDASFEDKLVAANDSGYIPAMIDLLIKEGIDPSEQKKMIHLIRSKDREAQWVTHEQEEQAKEAIATKEDLLDGKLTVVKMPHSKSATVTDRLFGTYKNLLILSGDGEVNFFGDGKLCEDLKTRFEGRNGGSGLGKEGEDAFRWIKCPNHEEIQKFVTDYLTGGETKDTESAAEVISETGILSIKWLATALGMAEELVTLPNGKEVMSLVRKPEHLPQVFELINKSQIKNSLGKNDVVTIDGVCPTRLLPTISHALHPVTTAVSYPQWGPDAKLPLSWAEMAGEWSAEWVKFSKEEDEEKTSISFELTNPSIDAVATLKSLIAPEVTAGKPVFISGRGPVAIATALAEAYAHRVPFVACFQPGTWRVVCISHSDTDLGTIFA